jgi:NAD(P)-dependent dehydrogenase (short-subunit alcohol dehydrogenase family)
VSGTALVTGGAKRLGRAIVLALAERGWDIALHYGRSEGAARRTAAEVESRGRACRLFQADLARFDQVTALVPAVARQCPDLGVLVNSASIFEPGGLLETTPDLYDRHFDINFRAPFFLSRDFARHAKAGVIVNLLDQRITRHEGGHLVYTLTKKALAALTEMAARELAPRIRVSGVCPGPILPPTGKDEAYLERMVSRVPLGRAGTPEEVARAVVFLVENEYVTGQLLFVDGGEHIT